MLKRFIHKIKFLIAGLIVWVRLGIPFGEAMRSMKEAEKIMWDEERPN